MSAGLLEKSGNRAVKFMHCLPAFHDTNTVLDTTSLTGDQWLVVIGLSLLAPAVVAVDKYVQLARQRRSSKEAISRSDMTVGA